jgi:hypothetical protein
MQTKYLRIGAVLAFAAVAGACEHAMLEDTIFDREYVERHLPNEEKVLSANTFIPRPSGIVQTYCYTTIGEVECYAHPQREERYRLYGYFGPAPE